MRDGGWMGDEWRMDGGWMEDGWIGEWIDAGIDGWMKRWRDEEVEKVFKNDGWMNNWIKIKKNK